MKMSLRTTQNCTECDRDLNSEESEGLRVLVALFGGENLCSGCNLPPSDEILKSIYYPNEIPWTAFTKIPHPSEEKTKGLVFRMPIEASGFRVFFPNGNLASIQWSQSHYAERDSKGRPISVEIAAMENRESGWHHFEDNQTVKGYVPVKRIESFLHWVGTHQLKTEPEEWDEE